MISKLQSESLQRLTHSTPRQLGIVEFELERLVQGNGCVEFQPGRSGVVEFQSPHSAWSAATTTKGVLYTFSEVRYIPADSLVK
jgi:hypothetical protein